MFQARADHGDRQMGRANTALRPFVVQAITDNPNMSVAGLRITWRVAVGEGDFTECHDTLDRNGFALATFRPARLGRYRIECLIGREIVPFTGVILPPLRQAAEDDGEQPDEEPVVLEDLDALQGSTATMTAESAPLPPQIPATPIAEDDHDLPPRHAADTAPAYPRVEIPPAVRRRRYRWKKPSRRSLLTAAAVFVAMILIAIFMKPSEGATLTQATLVAPMPTLPTPDAPTTAAPAKSATAPAISCVNAKWELVGTNILYHCQGP
jgi:hypothetical protein